MDHGVIFQTFLKPPSASFQYVQTDTSFSLQNTFYECRICFEIQQYRDMLIHPCNCSGSLKYVHEECLKKWISSKGNLQELKFQCQLCSFQIQFDVRKSKNWFAYENMLRMFELSKKLFWCFVSIIALNTFLFLLLIYHIWNLNLKKISWVGEYQLKIYIGSLFFVFFTYLICFVILRIFALPEKVEISRIQEKGQNIKKIEEKDNIQKEQSQGT